MYKLINPEGIVHDYARPMYWGHNIEGSDKGTPIEFANVQTLQYSWSVFSRNVLNVGDFITRRNHDHTKILLYELVKVEKCHDPGDMYEVTANLCGYYLPDGTLQVADGYGIVPVVENWLTTSINKLLGARKETK